MNTVLAPGHRKAPPIYLAVGFIVTALAVGHAHPANARVLVAATTLGVSNDVYEFDDSGNLLGTLIPTPAGHTLYSIATDGTRLIVGRDVDAFYEYSLDGSPRGSLPGVPGTSYGSTVELDSHGNIY